MKSPFPGMDPYLEKYWHEVHQSLVIYTRDLLQSQLPLPLRARIEQRVLLEEESDNWRAVYPDVHVVEFPQPSSPAAAVETAVAIEEEPVLITPQDEPLTEGYIEIVDAESGNRVITVIEFLSPTNKLAGWGRDQYQKKQSEYDSIRGEPCGNRSESYGPTHVCSGSPLDTGQLPHDVPNLRLAKYFAGPVRGLSCAAACVVCRRSAFRSARRTATCGWIFSRS